MQNTDSTQADNQQKTENTEQPAAPASGFGMAGAASAAAPEQPPAEPTPEAAAPAPEAAQPAPAAEAPAPEAAPAAPADEAAAPEGEAPAEPASLDDVPEDKDKAMEKQMGGDDKKAKPETLVPVSKSVAKMEKAKARAEKKMGPAGKGALNKQKIQTEFYRDKFHNLVYLALAKAVIIALILIAMIFYMFQTQPENRYFATTVDGRILKLSPLDEASIPEAELNTWMIQSVMETLSFGYHDYQRRLQDSTKYFTKPGWTSFASMLQEMRLIEEIEKKQLVVSGEPLGAPVLVQEGIVNGRYRWVIDINFRVSLQGKSVGTARPLRLRLTIERVPILENVKGIAIERWSVRAK